VVSVAVACRALGVSRATFYRRRSTAQLSATQRKKPARALTETERKQVIEVLHKPRFMDKAPTEIYASLLDEGVYHCSIRTMYRILKAENEIRERRKQLRHPVYVKPELLATGPNQVWSWDITKLRGPGKWQYYYLYVIMDIFSRCVVGWLIAERESSVLAQRLIADTVRKHGVPPGQLTIHADRGTSMSSKPVALLLADLGVTKTHSRPQTSNDNPYSEAQFKTLKYRPDFPDRFGSLEDARSFCRSFFRWYNHDHYHTGIALLTPATVHYGQAGAVIQKRTGVLEAAYHAHPERFVNKPPTPTPAPIAAWINKPSDPEMEPKMLP
jgi:putative transposase